MLLKNRATTSTSFYRKFYSIKIFDDKYEVVEVKNKTADKQSILETQNEPLELVKEKEPKFEESIAERTKFSRQKSKIMFQLLLFQPKTAKDVSNN